MNPAESTIPFILCLIIALVLDLILVIAPSRRWYRKQTERRQTRNIIFLGKGMPSPVLTFVSYVRQSLPLWWVDLKGLVRSAPARIGRTVRRELPRAVNWLRNVGAYAAGRISLFCRVMFRFLRRTFARIRTVLCRWFFRLIAWMDEANLRVRRWLCRLPQICFPSLSANRGNLVEISLIILWAFFVGRKLLGDTPGMVDYGDEYINLLQSHFAWTVLPKCGTCVFWNGFINGGAPAFVDTLGALLHPLVIVTTLAFGVIRGSNFVLVGSLAMAGIAQWWLARVMGLRHFSRLWAGLFVVVGGHLLGKMDNGNVVLVLSTASASLVLAPLLDLVRTRRRSSLIWSGITLALLIVSGQGYIQVGMVVAALPVFLIFLFDRHLRIQPAWKDFLLAGILAVLMAGVFLVPFLHFMPNFVKDADNNLSNYQTLEYLPLNLVIHDMNIYKSSHLGHDGNVYTNFIYIGWVPVLLALSSVPLFWKKQPRLLLFFWMGIFQVFLLCSKDFGKFVYHFFPLIAKLRWASIITGLTVPLIIGLAAWSLDHILHSASWPQWTWNRSDGQVLVFSLAFLVAGLPAVSSFHTPYTLSKIWLNQHPFEINAAILDELTPETAQWVKPNFSSYNWMGALLQRGVKLSEVWRPWFWRNREAPRPNRTAVYAFENYEPTTPFINHGEIEVMHYVENQYASVKAGDRQIPCRAEATGGFIDVTCMNDSDGELVVQENQWTGWTAFIDGHPAGLQPGKFLTVSAPAGRHVYQFRYWPWDVWVGLGLAVCGILLAVYLLWKAPDPL